MKRIPALLCAALLFIAPAWAMNNPGNFSLGDFQIAGAGTQFTPAPVGVSPPNFAGINAASFQVRMAGGSGGTKINVYIQTSIDGQNWIDIANIAFANTPGTEIINLSALDKLTTPTAPTYLALADNTVLDGILGTQFQAVIVSTGTYSGSTLVSVRGVAR